MSNVIVNYPPPTYDESIIDVSPENIVLNNVDNQENIHIIFDRIYNYGNIIKYLIFIDFLYCLYLGFNSYYGFFFLILFELIGYFGAKKYNIALCLIYLTFIVLSLVVVISNVIFDTANNYILLLFFNLTLLFVKLILLFTVLKFIIMIANLSQKEICEFNNYIELK